MANNFLHNTCAGGRTSQGINRAIDRAFSSFGEYRKPLIACLVGQPEARTQQEHRAVPLFIFPEEAVSSLGHAVEYGKWLQQPKGHIPEFPNIKSDQARSLVDEAMKSSPERPFWLSTPQACQLLDYCGINTVETAFASTADEAAEKAAQIGFPTAVKMNSATIAHKTEVGGIILGVETEQEVKEAFNEIRSRLSRENREAEMDGVVLQHMVSGGIETIAGVSEDPTFGHLIMFGIGGVYTELLHDVAVRLHPLTDVKCEAMIESLQLSGLLKGWRGNPPSDIEALKDMLLRLSFLVEQIQEITEVDLNPVMALPEGEGYRVLDPKIRLS
ncbi:MAG: acetate--CoA ligase family protein [Thermodesulfobacteriota bacterium]